MSERIEVDGAKPADSGRVTDAMVEAAIDMFNDFPCPMNGTICRTTNREQMSAAITAALAAHGQGDADLAGYVDTEQVADMQRNGGGVLIGSFSERYGRTVPVYFHPAPPASPAGVPDEATDEFVPRWWDESHGDAYKEGWNDCRKAMLAAAPSAPESNT